MLLYAIPPPYIHLSQPVVIGLACHMQRKEDGCHEGHTAAVDSAQDLLLIRPQLQVVD